MLFLLSIINFKKHLKLIIINDTINLLLSWFSKCLKVFKKELDNTMYVWYNKGVGKTKQKEKW